MAAAFSVIALAGLVSGILDISVTATLFKRKGIPYQRTLQFIASGALGPSALRAVRKSPRLVYCFTSA
jgi:hypothetical protein